MSITQTFSFIPIVVISLLFQSHVYGQFAPASLVDSNTTLITNIITADLNNDSLEDIIVTKKFSANSLISYYLNQGGLSFGPETVVAVGSSQVTNIAVGDFDNNNWLDIVSIGDADNSVTLYQNNALSFTTHPIDSFTFFESDIAVSDLDNDSDLDIVAIGGTTFKVYYNNGLASFTSKAVTTPLSDFFDITIGDIDADGYDDVITGGSTISVYKNNNDTLSYDSARTSQIPSAFNLFLRLVDLDHDGDLDLFSEDNNSSGARWMANDGSGNFSNLQMIDSSATNIRSGAFSDFDRDGDLDIILIKNFNLYLYSNHGQGSFSTPVLIQDTTTTINSVYASDLNNDSRADIIWSADLSVQENKVALSVNQHSAKNDRLEVYPNPATASLFIESEQAGLLTISNSLGQIVHKGMHLKKGSNMLELDLEPQLYFFSIEVNGEMAVKKVLIK